MMTGNVSGRVFNGSYEGPYQSRVAFPLGGIGAGMLCLEGSGALSHLSVRNRPDIFNEPAIFGALKVRGHAGPARVLTGPVPSWKLFGERGAGNGSGNMIHGLPRFAGASFLARFPFASVDLAQPDCPLRCAVTGWSPFLPGNADDSSLPMAVLEYRFENTSDSAVEAVFSFHAPNIMAAGGGQAKRDIRGQRLCPSPGRDGGSALGCRGVCDHVPRA